MRLNEKIGFSLLAIMVVITTVGIIAMRTNAIQFKWGALLLALIGVFGIAGNIFLSIWGMTTFNDYFEKENDETIHDR